MTPQELARILLDRAAQHQGRLMVALAGPPAAGKSTLAADLVAALGPGARVVPMDGFHYDDAVLIARGQRARKGAPETFDVRGFLHLLTRLRHEDEVAIPVFDRNLEIARAGAEIIGPEDRILVIEGNYLLLDEAPWTEAVYDMTIAIDVTLEELETRLLMRWARFGKTAQQARDWIEGNDLPNIRRVLNGSRAADLRITPAIRPAQRIG